MKSVPEALREHYASGSTTLARLWLAERRDGQLFAFTDHDRAIVFGSVRYKPSSSYDASAISTRSEPNVDNLELQGRLAGDGITAADIEAGLWDGAHIELREVNWADLTMGANVLRVGDLGEIQRQKGAYTAELRGVMQFLQNNIGRIVNPTCDAELGDERCRVDLVPLTETGEVVSQTGLRAFSVDGLTAESGFFSGGKVTFTSGENAGIAVEVMTHMATGSPISGGDFMLHLSLPYPLLPGDAFTVIPGCDKRKERDPETGLIVGDCKTKYNNVVNFRGFSFVPGQDAILLIGGQ